MKHAMKLVNPKLRLVLASAHTDKEMLREALHKHNAQPLAQPLEKHGLVFALGLAFGFILALLMVATDVQGAY